MMMHANEGLVDNCKKVVHSQFLHKFVVDRNFVCESFFYAECYGKEEKETYKKCAAKN